MAQSIIVGIIVAAALIYVILRLRGSSRGKGCGCGCDCGGEDRGNEHKNCKIK